MSKILDNLITVLLDHAEERDSVCDIGIVDLNDELIPDRFDALLVQLGDPTNHPWLLLELSGGGDRIWASLRATAAEQTEHSLDSLGDWAPYQLIDLRTLDHFDPTPSITWRRELGAEPLPHVDAGKYRVRPCQHPEEVDEGVRAPGPAWDLNLVDFYGADVTIGEFPSQQAACDFIATNPHEDDRWAKYLQPFRGMPLWARYTVLIERQLGEQDYAMFSGQQGGHDGSAAGAIRQVAAELQETAFDNGMAGFFRVVGRELHEGEPFDGVADQTFPLEGDDVWMDRLVDA